MILGPVDVRETERILKLEERKQKVTYRIDSSMSATDKEMSTSGTRVKRKESSFEVVKRDILSVSPGTSSCSSPMLNRNLLKLPTLARTCDQFGVSDRAAAAIASAVLQDVGIVTEENLTNVIDKNKVRRARGKARSLLRKEQVSTKIHIKSIYFDGRKDKTIYQEKKEHVSIIEEPGSVYVGHVSPTSSSGKSIAMSIYEFCVRRDVSFDQMCAIGCDGTVVNTGCKNGAIRYLELQIKKPLQWLICQIHSNELPLRHLFEHLDGRTTGPTQHLGPLGKMLENCETRPVVNFVPVVGFLPEVNLDDLSTDQQYLYKMCQVVSCGYCQPNLANLQPGKLSHARWLTKANRLLRLYISCENPSENLVILVNFVIKVYAPMWFSIKMHPSCKDGARHVFETIKLTRYLDDNFRKIIDPVIQRNAYFAHPENILLSMISDDRKHVRELGLRRILKSRSAAHSEIIRQFTVPKLNFNATDYTELINWMEVDVTPPPVLANITNEDLKLFIENNDTLEFPRFPCHTQAVERCVKLVTEASSCVIGEEARDGFIRLRVKSREIMPHFHHKAEYKVA
nr:unnamed protein product [Callosobruchus chinensis]